MTRNDDLEYPDPDHGHEGPFWRYVIPLVIVALIFIGLMALWVQARAGTLGL